MNIIKNALIIGGGIAGPVIPGGGGILRPVLVRILSTATLVSGRSGHFETFRGLHCEPESCRS